MPVKGNYSKENTMTTLFTIAAVVSLLMVLGTLKGVKTTEEVLLVTIAGLFSGLIVAAVATVVVSTFTNPLALAVAILATATGALAPIYGWKETTLEDYVPEPRGGHMNSGW